MSLSILHVAQPVDGGVARCVLDLVADQVARGWRVGVACPPGPLAVRVQAAGVEHELWRASRNPDPATVLQAWRLGRIIRNRFPDVVHLHSSKAGVAGRLAVRRRHATLFQPHAWPFFAARGAMRAAALAWERRAAPWADVIVCVSEGERTAGEEAGISAAWRVVPNGIDLAAFRAASAEERERARARLGLGPAPLAVCIGRLVRQKGQDVLVEAWPTVTARVPGAELVLVGSGPAEDELGGRARIIGGQEDVRDWLAAANVVVQPSRWEGLSYVVLEAMAAARAVVATDVAGMSEALGEDVELVPVDDSATLAAAVERRLLDPRGADAEGLALRERVAQNFDAARATQAMADVYAEVLERRRSQ